MRDYDNLVDDYRCNQFKNLRYAQAYILPQVYENLFRLDTAFKKGTIFKDLYRPYRGK
ncbi:hypothetical protein I3900191A7_11210 [Clostridium baratii]|uniref:Spore coat associated protein CotJA n=1 Tax=Clostridium nitritogenes TaxID=83340 RepID=A0ABN1LP30_9CLOT|nr:spore coat associated protein CotJA [Clostridium baratii]AQM59450.1 hypothetical protein NPD11_761 [Clostridium baratii]MBT9831582.1 spore coat associated protein CotJA [Clostridium baratii]MDY3208034.1 spore coat associated protein CotJA [Clostridium baratii]STB00016.1 spore coat associated protein [Clostridium baratii]